MKYILKLREEGHLVLASKILHTNRIKLEAPAFWAPGSFASWEALYASQGVYSRNILCLSLPNGDERIIYGSWAEFTRICPRIPAVLTKYCSNKRFLGQMR